MFGNFGGFDSPYRTHGGIFTEQFRCFSAAFLPGKERDVLNFGSKVILPPSALAKLGNLNIEYPLLFQLINEANNKITHAGVLEFIAEEGRVYVPRWIMTSLAIGEGQLIRITNKSLPQGTFVKIQPQSVDFLDISDPKAVLENAFRNYSTLTKDDIISFFYNEKQYDILIMEVKPENAVSILETDLEVEFAPPLGYVEPTFSKQPSGTSSKSSFESIKGKVLQHVVEPKANGWESFGQGQLLGTAKPTLSTMRSSPPNFESDIPRPLRLPLGQLFFGFPFKVHPSQEEKKEEPSNPMDKLGSGITLRQAQRQSKK
ncbi:ubiquitin fusion degradation protein [Coelomomyces lativittatus]|nr:ubiquitin fusion degradation protein [Coelomomyces lativittatus]